MGCHAEFLSTGKGAESFGRGLQRVFGTDHHEGLGEVGNLQQFWKCWSGSILQGVQINVSLGGHHGGDSCPPTPCEVAISQRNCLNVSWVSQTPFGAF